MENKTIIIILVVAIVVVAVYLGVGSEGAVVSAQGTSVIEVQPDTVSVYLNIEQKAETSQEAKDKMDEISDDVLTELIEIGLDKSQIRFVSFNVYPDYTWENNKQNENGFIASRQMFVETDDFELVPNIVDVSIDAGALVSYISFELSDELESEYKTQALEEASRDAIAKAKATALGVNKKLGRLVSVQNEDFNYYPYRAYKSAATDSAVGGIVQSASMNVYPQNIEVRATITVQYRLSAF